jgi:DNA-binding transcriptional LysR family regulator
LVVHRRFRNDGSVIERFIGSREIDDTSTHRFPTVERMRRDYKSARIVLSSNHLGFHKQMVLSGGGSAILPRYLVASDLARKVLHDVYPRERFVFDLKLVLPKGESLSTAAQAMVERVLARASL